MGIFDFFKKKKDTTPKRPAAIDTMSKADAITQAASQAAEAKANEEMDELTRLASSARRSTPSRVTTMPLLSVASAKRRRWEASRQNATWHAATKPDAA